MPVMRFAPVLVASLLFLACPSSPSGTDGGGGGSGGGTGGGGGGLDAFTVTVLDATAKDLEYFAVAADPAGERLGIAYFTPRGTETNAGVPDLDLKYVEWRQGTVSPVETLRFVQRRVGLSAAFQPDGQPAVAFLGGDDAFVPGMSIFWFQSDAVVATRSATGTWTQTTVAQTGGQVTCGNPVSDRGLLVGLWPSIVFGPTGTMYFAWRDGHDGQNTTDWSGSDVEIAEGSLTAPTLGCVNAGGNGALGGKPGWGGRIQLALGPNGLPGMVYDRALGGADTTGSDVFFQQRTAGGWSGPQPVAPTSDTMTGASLAWDSQEGWAVAVAEGATNELSYLTSMDGTNWSSPDLVFGSGTGGWWPSLAMDPQFHEPAIAFYVCSPRPNITATACSASEDELRVSQRGGTNWHQTLVDAEGGWAPKLGFFASGKRWVVYRHPKTGVLKLAVER